MSWREAEGSQEVPVGFLHRIVARDPPLGLALLRGLHDCETSRGMSSVWVMSRHFRPSEWAWMQEVGYAGGGGGGGVVGEHGSGWGERRGGGGGGVHHHCANPPPSQAATQPSQPPSKKRSKERFAFELGSDSDDAAIPCNKKPKHPPPQPPPHGLRRPSPPPNPPTPPRPPPPIPPPRPRPTPPRVPRRRTNVPRIRWSGRSSTYPTPPG